MSKDYRNFSNEVNGLIGEAKDQKNRHQRGQSHKFKVLTKEVNEIPVGSVVEVLSMSPDQLRHGDLVCLLKNDRPRIGRYLRIQGPHLVVARIGGVERLSPSDVLGRVVRAVHQGRDFNPGHQSALTAIVNRLTDFGTFAFARAFK